MSEPIRKTLASDAAVREATFSGVIAYLLLRHGTWMNVTDAHPHRPAFALAQKSAEDELVWRYQMAMQGKSTGQGLKHLVRALASIGLAIESDYRLPDDVRTVTDLVARSLGGEEAVESLHKYDLIHKGYVAELAVDFEAGIIHGQVDGIKDVVTFEGKTPKEVEKAFRDSVDDYLAMCEERGEQPNAPIPG